ncbi:hypothetical protein GCM10009850_012250 [Nonomuraea monospora]|uniref:Lipoprotein n=1 Tax=Nonomuraea monospora TaxID=568818 RepID=A0ABN3CA10_9ACTN
MSRVSSSPGRVFGVILAGCLALGGCAGAEPETGAPDPRTAVDVYVRGLNDNDYEAIARLAPPLNDPSEAIRGRLAAYGGKGITLATVDISSEITPKVAKARLEGAGAGGRYAETLLMERKGERWYIALGRNPALPSDRVTASTTRP